MSSLPYKKYADHFKGDLNLAVKLPDNVQSPPPLKPSSLQSPPPLPKKPLDRCDATGGWSLVHWRSPHAWKAVYHNENSGSSSSEVEEADAGGFP
ncbi:hypothetical protein MTR_5g041580 [Medicago truncatula]|uniref:Uncharacterized protein n=1 Tax=Medicago truncatula TaxID=3880 RepID=G7KGN0_MEDTR|nr:hypothetical protein MTR_5g041580 [Medicago truncatula]